MSSLPEIFKAQQNLYIKPSKQGGIYTLKYQQNIQDYVSIIQPQQFFSVKTSKNESRAGTSHTMRSQKKVSFTDTRNIATSQSYRKASSRNACSRASSRQIRRDIFSNYGNSRVTFMIGQTAPLNTQQAQSLIHKINQIIQQAKKCDQILKQTQRVGIQIKQQMSRINYDINCEIKQIEIGAQRQMSKLRTILSDLRRSSGMEIKVNKTDLMGVQQNLQTISTILNQIDQTSAQLRQMCIK